MGLLTWIMLLLGAFAVAFFALTYVVPGLAALYSGPLIIGVFVVGLIAVAAFVRRRRGNRPRV